MEEEVNSWRGLSSNWGILLQLDEQCPVEMECEFQMKFLVATLKTYVQ